MNVAETWVKFKASPEFGLDSLDNRITRIWGPVKRGVGVAHCLPHIPHLPCINLCAVLSNPRTIPSVFFQVKPNCPS
jgi:hypothetical protein